MRLAELIEQAMPYDGPHDSDTVCEASRGLATLVRYLNNATGVWNGERTLQYAPTVHDVLGGIEAATFGFDQLLTQLSDALDRQAHDQTLYDDRRDRSAADTASRAAERIRDARDLAAVVAARVGQAHGLTARLGHDADVGGDPR